MRRRPRRGTIYLMTLGTALIVSVLAMAALLAVRIERAQIDDVADTTNLVHAYVFEVEGYKKPWFTISSALTMSASQVVAVVAARYRQEDGFRDHKQRLGMEECRAWTKEPILRTFQIQMIAMTLLRLTQFCLDEVWGEETWWHRPEWNRRKNHPSVLDLRRLFWHHRGGFPSS